MKARPAIVHDRRGRLTLPGDDRRRVEGFVAFFEPFIANNPKRDIRIVRALEDGNHVFVHAYQSLNDGEAEW
ncbi:MAG: hypothetical protein ACR2O6_12195 [Ilumatobacteraceae bacterium]